MVETVILSWSGGKDSAMAFRALTCDTRYKIRSLLTTVTEGYDRVSMHGVRVSLLDQQAKALGLPVVKVPIAQASSNEQYDSAMREVLAREHTNGVTTIAFGDVSLEEVRRYREERLGQVGMKAAFPLWKSDTRRLALEFINAGFRAILTCVDSRQLDGTFVGRTLDRSLLADLPPGVDPSGENGEFHTFVYEGPIFSKSIPVRKGEIVLRENRFYYCDLLLDTGE
jgi:uncharacterized protein (TIGR00290 family)